MFHQRSRSTPVTHEKKGDSISIQRVRYFVIRLARTPHRIPASHDEHNDLKNHLTNKLDYEWCC